MSDFDYKVMADRGLELLRRYRSGRAGLERRVTESYRRFRMLHREGGYAGAWLFNIIAGKHADAMDAYPAPHVTPREQGDEAAAELLTELLPVILERSDFERVWSELWWKKLRCGTGILGVFWNGSDIEIRCVDILNLYWEPGITKLQDSANVFAVSLIDNERAQELYPGFVPVNGTAAALPRYYSDEYADTSEKTVVVDWYYKKGGKLHFAKLVGESVVYCSEDDVYCEGGFYEHGMYPFIIDSMFPDEGSPAGFGYIDILQGTQDAIDSLTAAVTESAMRSAKKRYFIRDTGAVNEKEFADWGRDFVHSAGLSLGEDSIREIRTEPVSSSALTVLNMKVEELKETSGSRDFTQGGVTGGITAASAITALQEAGNKLGRDMLRGSYRAYSEVCRLCIELIRSFYTGSRIFRIVGSEGLRYVQFNGEMLAKRYKEQGFGLPALECEPIFDISVTAERSTAFSKNTQNELIVELYRLGFFNPGNAPAALAALKGMDFEGKDRVMRSIAEATGGEL